MPSRIPADENSPDQSGLDALASMRECYSGLRQHLRVLQVAKIKDWKVAIKLSQLQAKEEVEDPLLEQVSS